MGTSDSSIPVIGVVGGVGSGKSTVASQFAALGCAVIDGDAIGHELLRKEDVRQEIHHRWGDAVFTDTGEVNRRALAKVVFTDETQLSALNQILHPRIRSRIVEEIKSFQGEDFPAIVLDAAVLFEAGWDDLCSKTIFVDTPLKERLLRLRRTRGWDQQVAQDRESSQISLDKKAARCCYIVNNRSNVSHLHEQVRRFLHQIIHQ